MSTHKQNRQRIGRILLDGGFFSSTDLEKELAEQQHANEPPGQIHERMAVIDPIEFKASLSVQEHSDNLEGSIWFAAGIRHMLGSSRIMADRITHVQLERAIAEKKITGEKRRGVLGEGGYAVFHQVKRGIRFQHRLVTVALAAILAFSGIILSGCGGGGGEDPGPAPVTTINGVEPAVKTAYLTVTSDDYTLKTPTFYYSTVCESFWSIQANIARYVQDIDTRCIIRIDVPKIDGSWPNLNKKFSIEDNPLYEKFPGTIFVFNGSQSTINKVEHGIISFTPDSVTSEHVDGTFEVTVTDYSSMSLPLVQYHLKGVFKFKMGEYGPAKT